MAFLRKVRSWWQREKMEEWKKTLRVGWGHRLWDVVRSLNVILIGIEATGVFKAGLEVGEDMTYDIRSNFVGYDWLT